MARMKELAIQLSNLGYDPETVTLAQLSRPRTNETPEGRTIRLAAKAIAGGCESVWVERDGWMEPIGVTSATVAGLVYRLNVDGSCPCEGFRGHKTCCHVALIALEVGAISTCYVDRADALAAIRAGDGRWNGDVTHEVLRAVGRGDGERVAA